jgi:hypothetical protein
MKLLRLFVVVTILMLAVAIPAAAQEGGVAAVDALSYTSCFQVQNLTSTVANITVSYYQQGNATPTDVSDTVPASGSKTYCPLSAVSAGFNGSVVISSDQAVAAVANVTGGNWASFDASYAGFSAGAQTVSIPLLMKGNYGYNTWFNVQNAGGAEATVQVNYSDGTSQTKTIQPNLAVTFDQATETHSAAVFAATITSDQPVVAAVVEVGPTMLFAYDGFTAASPNPVMPLVQANNWGYTTGIQIQNAGGSPTTVTVTFTPSLSGTACTQTKSIAVGASETFALNAWAGSDANSDNTCVNGETFVGSASVTSNSASQNLVGIVNQHNFTNNKGAAYGTFNSGAATAKVVMPLITDRNYGYFTGFNIQNVGTQATTVACTFSNSAVTAGATIQPGGAFTDIQLNKLGNPYVGSATCLATGGDAKIVGVVNYLSSSGSTDTFMVYEAFNVTP